MLVYQRVAGELASPGRVSSAGRHDADVLRSRTGLNERFKASWWRIASFPPRPGPYRGPGGNLRMSMISMVDTQILGVSINGVIHMVNIWFIYIYIYNYIYIWFIYGSYIH